LKFLNYKHRQFVKKKRYGVGFSDGRKLPKNKDLSKDSAIKAEELAKSYIEKIGGRLV